MAGSKEDVMTRIVILAAGKGKRMAVDQPKVLVPLEGRPMISYLLDSIMAAGLDPHPIVVVSPHNRGAIMSALERHPLSYAVQEEQLGTGHAVSCALPQCGEAEEILVLYGDHPFYKPASLSRITASQPRPLNLLTTVLEDFSGWRRSYYHWGRIVRDSSGEIVEIKEFKDASAEEKLVTEVNPAVMCFNRTWLSKSLSALDNNNKSGEFYLTDLVQLARREGVGIKTVAVEPREAMGINSQEELEIARRLLQEL